MQTRKMSDLSAMGRKLLTLLSFACLAWSLLVPAPAAGQANLATVLGLVTDSGGAVVPRCSITLRNQSTNATLHATTDADGNYVFPNLLPGTYEITVVAPGFSRYVVSDITVDAGQTVRRNAPLAVGAAQTIIRVTSTEPLVQTDTSSVGSVIDSKQIDQTPLLDRTTWWGLLAMAPGVQNAGTDPNVAGSAYTGGYNVTLDGVNDMNVENARLNQVDLSLDAMDEFKVVDVNASAEYGPGTTQIIISSKQGTNQFHGTLFEYNSDTEVNARPFFSTVLAPHLENQYGGSLGGPILHNKLFFFGSFEGLQDTTPVTKVNNQPTQALLQGNFAGLPTIINPETQTPFSSNQIPSSSFSTVSKAFFPYFETANIATSSAGGLGANFTATMASTETDWRYEGRIDYTINPSNSMFVKYYYVNEVSNSPGATPLEGGSSAQYIPQSISGNYTHIFSPTKTNILTFEQWLWADLHATQHPTFDAASLVPNLPASYPGLSGLPAISITGFQGISETAGSKDSQPDTQLSDVYTSILRHHTLKAGFSYLHYTFHNWQMPTLGSFSFTGMYTGNAFADFLLGDLATDTQPVSPLQDQPTNDRYGFFVQDDCQATRNLTINLGVRYDLPTLYENVSGGMSNYYPNLQELVVLKGSYNPSDFTEPIVEGSSVGLSTSNWIGNDHWQIQPRFGFAIRPSDTSRFIVRGGWGLYYQTTPWLFGSFETGVNPPFSGTVTFEPNAGKTPSLFFNNPFPTGSGAPPSGVNIHGYPQNYGYPRTNQWNLTLESQVASDLALRATYLGSVRWDSTFLNPINTPPLAPGPIQTRRPVPAFGDIDMYDNGTTANTQMLELSVLRRFKSGLSFEGEYSLTHQIINSVSDDTELTDPQNLRYDRGNDTNIRPQYFIGNYVYDLPFGKGQRFLTKAHGPLEWLLGGWEDSGIVTIADGNPFSVTFSSTVQGWTASRADQIGNYHVADPSIKQWFNPSAFALPAQFTYGTSGKNVYYGPGYADWDTGVMKNFAISERAKVQFRMEMFNALNHPSFSTPNSNISVPSTVGTITSTTSSPRAVQFAARFEF